MNELEDNDVRDERERLVACVLSGNSKMYLGKEYTEQQINEMDHNDVNTLLNRYEYSGHLRHGDFFRGTKISTALV